jgi:hypothetical protein
MGKINIEKDEMHVIKESDDKDGCRSEYVRKERIKRK